MVKAYIGLGANLGKRQLALRQALAKLGEIPGLKVTAVATFRETEPVGGPDHQPKYMNGAAELETTLTAEALLGVLLQIEQQLGRDRKKEVRFGPRTIDLDLLLYGEEVIEITGGEMALVVPHPRMHERGFVLEPLLEIAPEVRHPVLGKTIRQLWSELERKP